MSREVPPQNVVLFPLDRGKLYPKVFHLGKRETLKRIQFFTIDFLFANSEFGVVSGNAVSLEEIGRIVIPIRFL